MRIVLTYRVLSNAAIGVWVARRPPARRSGRDSIRTGLGLCVTIWMATVMSAGMHGQGASPVRTVDAVDLERYAGDWFEIARFPNRFQRDCVSDVRATYTRRPDGRIDVLNRCRTATNETIDARGVARVVDARTSARLKVRFAPALLSFLPFVWGDYWVLGLAGDYSWAVVGSPDREYLWILAREPALPQADLEAALAAARKNGFDVDRLQKTTHASRDGDGAR